MAQDRHDQTQQGETLQDILAGVAALFFFLICSFWIVGIFG